ncbi:MAG: hypothetical protein ACLUEV_03145 [Alistipes sp.]
MVFLPGVINGLPAQGQDDVVGLFMRSWKDTTGTLRRGPVRRPHVRQNWWPSGSTSVHLIDLSDEYRRRVVDYMFAEYGRGRTPNPDVLCNREIKFDAFLKAALDLGADYVATGHYCRREDVEIDGRTVHRLLAGSDPNKDQSYFLCQLTQRQLSRALFPIGPLRTPEVRRIAAEQHLATAARKDSQGICFVGKVDLPVFTQQWLEAREGDIVGCRPRGTATVRWPTARRSMSWLRRTRTRRRTERASDGIAGRISSRSGSARA